MKRALATIAPRTKVITKSTFKNYDVCMNPYVGCEFGCSYCYVRFFVKDEVNEWGEFVRVRQHLEEFLPKELRKGQVKLADGRQPDLNDDGIQKRDENGKAMTKPKHKTLAIQDARLVIGTMTDPYQPKEAKHRITRTALQILLQPDVPQFNKVGIFTRSPLVLQDIDLIKRLPRARVHFTITPFPHAVMRAIEPISPLTERRWETVKKLKEAGIRVHVNVSPVMPGMSESLVDEWAQKLAELKIDEFFVDPMQPYKESFDAFRNACVGVKEVNWAETEAVMKDKTQFLDWKFDFFTKFKAAWDKSKHLSPNTLAIWSDHENKVWVNMENGQQMDSRRYGSDL